MGSLPDGKTGIFSLNIKELIELSKEDSRLDDIRGALLSAIAVRNRLNNVVICAGRALIKRKRERERRRRYRVMIERLFTSYVATLEFLML